MHKYIVFNNSTNKNNLRYKTLTLRKYLKCINNNNFKIKSQRIIDPFCEIIEKEKRIFKYCYCQPR